VYIRIRRTNDPEKITLPYAPYEVLFFIIILILLHLHLSSAALICFKMFYNAVRALFLFFFFHFSAGRDRPSEINGRV